MARGWESKSVEDQQHEAERRQAPAGPRESSATDRRRTLELARAQTLDRIRTAHSEVQRESLARALADLEAQTARSVVKRDDLEGRIVHGYSRSFDRALVLAALVHDGVPRKGTVIPYIIHPIQVSTILLRHGYGDMLAVAALLHDVIEDIDYDNGRLQLAVRSTFPAAPLPERIVDGGSFRDAFLRFFLEEFGDEVVGLVRQVTEPKNDGGPSRSWRERKEGTVAHLHGAPDAVVALKAADALHNVRSIVEDIAHHGATVLGRFKASKQDTAWYYREVSRLVTARLADAPLAIELREATEALVSAMKG